MLFNTYYRYLYQEETPPNLVICLRNKFDKLLAKSSYSDITALAVYHSQQRPQHGSVGYIRANYLERRDELKRPQSDIKILSLIIS